jgi:glutamate-1-semialdehyde aminotransferase
MNEDVSGSYIKHIRKLTKEYGILLVLDEVWTGFRLALGGAQEYFGVDPDLASYAKAMANGYPISTYVGKRQYMSELNQFRMTTTYAGETLSMAAAIATISIMKREPVHKHLWAMGERLMQGFNVIAKDLGVEGYAAGLPPSSFLKFNTPDSAYNQRLEYLWFRELFREGVFVILRWFISYSHKQTDIDITLEKAKRALQRALDAEPKERQSIKPFYW